MTDHHTLLQNAFHHNGLAFDLNQLRSKSRDAKLTMQRRLAVQTLRLAGLSYQAIGSIINRAHCSCMHLDKTCAPVQGMDYKPVLMKFMLQEEWGGENGY